jgi:hypothetical protein
MTATRLPFKPLKSALVFVPSMMYIAVANTEQPLASANAKRVQATTVVVVNDRE